MSIAHRHTKWIFQTTLELKSKLITDRQLGRRDHTAKAIVREGTASNVQPKHNSEGKR